MILGACSTAIESSGIDRNPTGIHTIDIESSSYVTLYLLTGLYWVHDASLQRKAKRKLSSHSSPLAITYPKSRHADPLPALLPLAVHETLRCRGSRRATSFCLRFWSFLSSPNTSEHHRNSVSRRLFYSKHRLLKLCAAQREGSHSPILS